VRAPKHCPHTVTTEEGMNDVCMGCGANIWRVAEVSPAHTPDLIARLQAASDFAGMPWYFMRDLKSAASLLRMVRDMKPVTGIRDALVLAE
jgi:hypothetical protein